MLALTIALAIGFGALCSLLGFYSGVAHMARSINREMERAS